MMASSNNKNPSNTSLINALVDEDLDVADALLEHQQCDVNEQDHEGYTPLMFCCAYEVERSSRRDMHVKLFRKIMAVDGIDVNLCNKYGHSALMVACVTCELPECVELLLSNPQCNLCLQNDDGLSALHHLFFWQIYSKNKKSILHMFMDHHRFASCAALLTNGGFSALDYFLMNPKLVSPDLEISLEGKELLSLLLSKGECFKTSQATMALAVKYAGFDTCVRLYDASFSCDSTLPDNETATHCAAQLGSQKKLDFILGHTKIALGIQWKQRFVDNLTASPKHEIDYSKTKKTIPIYIGSLALISEMIDTKMFREADKHTPIYQQNDIVFAVKNCKLCNVYEEDFRNMANVAIKIAKHISDKFASDARFKHLVFTPILSGSMAEGTKSYLPDEVDIVCRLDNNDNIVHSGSTDHTVRLRANNVFEHFCNSFGDIMPSKLNRDFVNAVDIVIQEGHDQLSYEDENYSMILGKFALQFEDKIPRLVMNYNSDRLQNLNISIDLALAFPCSSYSPERPLPLHVKCNEYYALAKVSRCDDWEDRFPISYSSGEQALMASLPEHVRDGYILAKAMRLTAVCEQPGLNRKVLQLLEPIDITKYISSYMLKNSLFVIMQKIENREMNIIEPCGIDWANATYCELIDQLKTDRCIRVWYDKTQYLLNCTDHDQDILACCQKRHLILALSYQIQFWLAANRAKLKSHGKPSSLATELSILLKSI